MEAKKCWCCKGPMELKHYPAEICSACHHAGGGVERRDLFVRADMKETVSDPTEGKSKEELWDLIFDIFRKLVND